VTSFTVRCLDDAAQVFGLDREFAHAVGVPPAEAGRESNPRGIVLAAMFHFHAAREDLNRFARLPLIRARWISGGEHHAHRPGH
jgi:hypothetical protein